MNVGIITFHWGANHGAVLQVYALSEYLKTTYNINVEVIDYCPERMQINIKNILKLRRISTVISKIKEYRKNIQIEEFRKQLPLSEKYISNEQLKNTSLKYDVLITGSDQIWNPFFLLKGEGKVTPVYFLNFGKEDVKKVSVSASFGCEKYPEKCQSLVKQYLKEFHAISVRENSGKAILDEMGILSIVTADPTSLLPAEHYLKLCNESFDSNCIISKMILRKQSPEIKQLLKDIDSKLGDKRIVDIEMYSIPNWLSAIRNSELVITNSFHCVMMCLKLHTPFVVVLESGQRSGMNDRFKTLLDKFLLSNRIVKSIDDLNCIYTDIDFDKVDEYMDEYAESLKAFLNQNIK